MSQSTVSKAKKFILPYSTAEAGRESKIPQMELAAIYALGETNRRKGGLLRHAKEEIEFIAKIGYPLWSFPFSKDVFLFDGLNVSKSALPYAEIGNVDTFVDRLKNSAKIGEIYSAFIAEQAKSFPEPNEKNSFELNGLIVDPGFLQEFAHHRKEATTNQDEFALTGLLAPRVEESSLMSIAAEVFGLASTLRKEVKDLKDSIQFLGKTSIANHNEILAQIKAVKEETALEIKQEEAIIAPQLKALDQEYNNEIVDLAKSIENMQVPLHAETIRLKKSKEEINQRIEKYGVNSKSVSKNDPAGKEGWKVKINKAKEELSTINRKIEDNEKSVEDLETRRASEASKLRVELESEVRKTRSKIVEHEAARDAKVLLMRQENETLQKNTKLVSDRITKIIHSREASINRTQKLHIRPLSDECDKAVIYVPHYVICYNSGKKRRYVSLPPSFLNTVGISAKLKGALGVHRIGSCLSPRLKEMASLGTTIEKQSREDTIFETELRQLGEKNNILKVSWISDEVEKGLLNLKKQGWLNDKEFGAIMATAKKDLQQR